MTSTAHKYDDIIELSHHVSETHPRMSREQRAAQFSPFAALSGYDDSVEEAARYTQERIELDENMRAELDMKMRRALEGAALVRIGYFVSDSRKGGGSYESVDARIARIDEFEDEVVLADGQRIPLADIVSID